MEATVGLANTPIAAFCRSTPVRFSGWNWRATVVTSRCILGGLPSSTFMGMLTQTPTLGTDVSSLPPEGASLAWGGPARRAAVA